MPPHLKKLIIQVHVENGTYKRIIVSHLEKKLELKGLEAPSELQINTVTQEATQKNPKKPKPTCHHCKKPGQYRNQFHQLKREKDQGQNNKNSAENNESNDSVVQTNSNFHRKIPNITNANNTNNQS